MFLQFCRGRYKAPSIVERERPGLLQRILPSLGGSDALLRELQGEREALESARLMVQGARAVAGTGELSVFFSIIIIEWDIMGYQRNTI